MDKKLKKVLNLKPHFNIADSIPLRSISDDGITEIAEGLYSRTYKVQDINFGIARREERGAISAKWAGVLKSIDPSYDLQVCIYNHSVDIDYLSDIVLLQEAGDGKDGLRADINRIVKRNMTEGNNGIRRDIYLTLTIPAPDMAAAVQSFAGAEHDILSILRSIRGCGAKPLKALKRLNLLHDMFQGGEESEMKEYGFYNRERVRSFSLENLYRSGVTAVELIQPESMEFKSDHFILGGAYGRAFHLSDFPTVVTDAFMREFTSMPFNLLMTTNLHQIEALKALNLVKAQRTNASGSFAEAQKKASQQGYSAELVNPDLAKNYHAANDLLIDMERRDQKLFETKMHVVIFAKSLEQLDKNCGTFLTKCRSKSVQFKVSYGLQENALMSSMPFGLDSTPQFRTLTTESLAVFVPFSSQEMTQRGGTVYGLNKVTHNIITFNRMMADSYNMLILGFTGSGKSFFAKKEILNTYLNGSNDGDVVVIDPQGEYGKLCRSVGGEEVHIKGAGEHHINPLDISASYDENPVAAKVEFIRSMCAEMLSYTPDATQKTAIAVAAKRCYDAWLLSGDDGDIPTLNDFYLALCDYYNSEDGRLQSVLDVVKAVEFYVAGVDTLFQGHSNINTEASFISYDISELGEGIRPLAMLIILDSILNRMSRNRKLNRPTFVYIDEIHLLFQKEQTAQWIKKLWKTARKYKCCPCGLTQDCEDLLATDTGRAVLTNTAFVVLLKQQAINAGVLAEQLQLSARQLEYVTDTPPGEGLLCIQNASRFTGGVIPFEDHFPEDSLLFEICQTSSTETVGR